MAPNSTGVSVSSHAGEPVLVALGSNMGDRWSYLRRGAERLAGLMDIRSTSSVWESPACGGVPQNDYLNAVVFGHTEHSPGYIMKALLAIESDLGRIRTERNAPRTLDLDLLFLGRHLLQNEGLTLPHPRWKERPFVVLPLLEVAPDFVDPESDVAIGDLFPEGIGAAGARNVGLLAHSDATPTSTLP